MGWQAIDRAEVAAGEPHGRPRVKFCRVARDGRGLAPGRRRAEMADLAEIGTLIEAALPGRRGRGARRGRRRPPARDRRRAAVRRDEADRPAPRGAQRGPARGSTTARSTRCRSRPRSSARAEPTAWLPWVHGSRSRTQAAGRAGDRRNSVLLLMKGTPEAPRCGFSMRVVGVLEQLGVDYGAIDVLPALQPLREVTTELSDWQTFPQLYVNGELVGGCRHRRGDARLRRARRAARRRAAGRRRGARAAAHPSRRVADEPADAARLSSRSA